MRRALLLLPLLLSIPSDGRTAPGDATRWSPLGHRLIATLAEDQLTARTAERARDLLGGLSLPDVAAWADSIRPTHPTTAPWHYVNVPIGDPGYDAARHCPAPPGCVTWAISHFSSVLADASAPRAERAVALRYLVHFVGDLHQPLHAGDDHDRGGNDVRVTFLGRRMNLHSLWDRALIESRGLRESEWIALLRARREFLPLDSIRAGTVEEWTSESHARARQSAYDLPADRVLPATYATSRTSLLEEVLIRGGVRLAHLLNVALDPDPRRPGQQGPE